MFKLGLLLCAAALLHAPTSAQEVLVGSSPTNGFVAYLSGAQGLVIRNWPAAGRTLRIGHGSQPRFDADGNLYFARNFDDGVNLTRRTTMVVERGSTRPRPLRIDEAAPPYRLPAPGGNAAAVKICVDAGHGGSDPGASGNGLLEKNINLDVALRLKALLDLDSADPRGGGDWDLLMTRTSDVTLSLSARTNMANAFAAASFLSVHMNAFGSSSANGSETFCYLNQQGGPGGLYRNRLHAELIAAWGLTNRGVKTANFHVLRETRMPAALIEGGFVTNPTDAAKMGQAGNRQRLALGLLWAIQEHHGFSRYTPQTGGTTGNLRGVVYDASQGTGARITDATVSLVSGDFAVSSNNGNFLFSVAPGTYRYAATAPGFLPAELSRTVTANADVWGSLGLTPARVPALRSPSAPSAGSTFSMILAGDSGSPAFLLIGDRPALPFVDFGGAGPLWLNPSQSVVVALPAIPGSGLLVIPVQAPNVPGLQAHAQAFVRTTGIFRLSNGVGVRLR